MRYRLGLMAGAIVIGIVRDQGPRERSREVGDHGGGGSQSGRRFLTHRPCVRVGGGHPSGFQLCLDGATHAADRKFGAVRFIRRG
jgi:hypothetical protein